MRYSRNVKILIKVKINTIQKIPFFSRFLLLVGFLYLPLPLYFYTQVTTNNLYTIIFLQFILALGFVVTSMLATHLLGPKRKTKQKLLNTEAGIAVVGNARLPFNIKYFVVAILFVLFDVEIIFMYPWAVNFKELGMFGFVEMLIFITTLLIGFFYILKKGALKWEK